MKILFSQRSAYKKINRDTYDIHDYICRWTLEEAIEKWEQAAEDGYLRQEYQTLEEWIFYWKKIMINK